MDSSQTIYTQTPGQIFFKNFIAGFAKGLGNISIYVLFIILIFHLLIKPRLTQISEFFNLYKNSMQMFQQKQDSPSIDINNLLQQLQPQATSPNEL